jgi:uncharacterized protein
MQTVVVPNPQWFGSHQAVVPYGSNDGDVCSDSVRDRPLPQSRRPCPHDFRARRLGGCTFWGKILADQLSAAANPNRVRFYALTLCFEWLLFVVVLAGVRRSGEPVLIVLGDRWHSVRQVLRDIGIAAAFWTVSIVLLFILGRLLRVAALGRNMEFMLPHGDAEITLWIALSVTAGICEETIFRGYLQRQFMALTQSVPAGILLSGVAFGAAHAYQGAYGERF